MPMPNALFNEDGRPRRRRRLGKKHWRVAFKAPIQARTKTRQKKGINSRNFLVHHHHQSARVVGCQIEGKAMPRSRGYIASFFFTIHTQRTQKKAKLRVLREYITAAAAAGRLVGRSGLPSPPPRYMCDCVREPELRVFRFSLTSFLGAAL